MLRQVGAFDPMTRTNVSGGSGGGGGGGGRFGREMNGQLERI